MEKQPGKVSGHGMDGVTWTKVFEMEVTGLWLGAGTEACGWTVQGSAKLSRKRPDGKYLHLLGPYGLCCNYSAIVAQKQV